MSKITKTPLSEVPYRYFKEFIAPETDRFAFLSALLDKLGLRRSTLTIAGNRHFMVFPPHEGQSSPKGQKGQAFQASSVPIVLVAHYDRAADSPGANDNSAAVFLLIETAMKLWQKKGKNWLIIFTDKEELTQDEGIKSQGSYTLAMGLRQAGLGRGRFFIFDACGTGDTLIISTTADHLMKNEKGLGIIKTRQAVQQLRNLALETTRELQMDKVLLLPTPFSDDAGFLRAGIPAQTITVLPGKEASPFISLLRNNSGLDQALVNREIQKNYDRRLIPETWRCLNGPGDSYPRLTPEHFSQVVRFACALSKK
ncbi:M28 family metallopeptidase [Treponema sp. TIM-1]|uniref:M28 family peptidase n=1 Tax=Treponema sp. TIM-1 TaxID=2898417 RepID=UPI00397F0363